jgi:hypothetical protein
MKEDKLTEIEVKQNGKRVFMLKFRNDKYTDKIRNGLLLDVVPNVILWDDLEYMDNKIKQGNI